MRCNAMQKTTSAISLHAEIKTSPDARALDIGQPGACVDAGRASVVKTCACIANTATLLKTTLGALTCRE
ncbi:hypothetical protein E2C01_072407 [Portunus trituberculatus]|uniref:Uncharacterized protein n=1 Tax=Portunus trituberculatus TaxID=210409 RepID=A0A5B7IAM4_PORTR|nr:hypothetical protein [Portunus trituberculatus]